MRFGPRFPALLLLAVVPSIGQVAPGPHPSAAFPGDWLQFRGDRKLTGRSRLVGNIAPPTVASATTVGLQRQSLPTLSYSSAVVNINTGSFVDSQGQTITNQAANVAFKQISTSDGLSYSNFGFFFVQTVGSTTVFLQFRPSVDPNLAGIPGFTQDVEWVVDTVNQKVISATDLGALPLNLQHLLLAIAANLASIYTNATQVVTSGGNSAPVWTIAEVTTLAGTVSNVIFQPSPILWSLFIGARQTSVAFEPASGAASTVNLPAADSNAGALASNATWGIGPPSYDLNQNGNPIVFPIFDTQAKIGQFIAGNTNFQKVEFDACTNCTPVSTSPTSPEGADGFGHLYQWQSGAWVEQWKTPPTPLLFQPNTIVGDFDHDGRLEVAMEPWWNIQVYDLQTGALKTSARAVPDDVLTGREYGWLGAYDLNGDGTQEFVALGLFENFIAVMGWKDGQLVKLWDHTIEILHDLAQTIHATTVYPVQDVNGDGILDVVTSIYNEKGDGQWHVVARDGMTGKVLTDLPGRYLLGMTDVNGDGVAEMFTIATIGQLTPQYGQVDVMSLRGGTLTTLLELNGASVATQPYQQLPRNINTGNQLSDLVAGPIAKGGLPVFFTQRLVDANHGTIELTPWQWSKGALTSLGTITGPYLQVLATRPADPGSPGFLISAAVSGNSAGSLAVSGVSGTAVQSSLMPAPLSSAAVAHLRPSDPPTVIVQNALQQLVAFRPSSASGGGTVLWTHRGRGGWTGADDYTGQYGYSGPLLASLTGDGTLQTIAATSGETGQAQIVAIQPDGSDLWTSDLSKYPGAPPPPDNPGVTLLLAGRFRNSDREDVLVAARSETVASVELNLLDGSTGQLVWNDGNGTTGIIPAPTHDTPGNQWFAVYDWNHTGLDEVAGTSNYTYWVKNGADTNLISRCFDVYFTPSGCAVFRPDSSWFDNFWPTSGVPVIADFLNNGTDTMLYGGSLYLLGLIDPISGRGIWQGKAEAGTPGFLQGIADLDGDGTLSLVSAGAAGPNGSAVLNVNRGSTGQRLWSIPLPGCSPFLLGTGLSPVTPVTVGDINGDGRDEAIFACNTTLYVAGADRGNQSGKILWSLDLGTSLDTPILADAEGNGQLEIIVVGSNGYVYGIGSLPSNSPPAAHAPAISANGVVEGATFTPGQVAAGGWFKTQGTTLTSVSNLRQVAPGSWFTVVGANLSAGSYQAKATPLPQQLNGTVVTVNGQIARLNAVNAGRISAEMPPDTPIGAATVVVKTADGSSQAASVKIVPALPEFFQYGSNRAVAQNPDKSLNGPQHPVAPGSSLILYFTGGGLVNGDRRTGVPAPAAPPMPLRLPANVTIAGHPAELSFAGLTPGLVGVYQADVTVPATLSAGDHRVTITVGGITSSSALISVK